LSGLPARIGLVLGALVLAVLSILVTLANVYANTVPSRALRLWPGHAVAEARLADSVIAAIPQNAPARQREQQIVQAARDAAVALQRNPTLPAAARILAMAAAVRRDQRQSERLLQYSEQMSRRDIPTQFWLLEKRVAANDVGGALSHFGIALQVAPTTREVLFPVLSSALSQPDLRRPIAELVHRGDAWRSDFLYHAGTNADPASAGTLFLILAQLRTPPAPQHLQILIDRLVTAGNFAGAARLYALVDRSWRLDEAGAQLDGGFARASDLPPFGWELNQNIAFRGGRPDQAENNALQINLSSTGEDWAARKLLLLGPGRYRLAAAYGTMDGGAGRVRFELACSRGGSVVSTLTATVNRPSGTLDGTLDIPAGCRQQWLTIQAAGEGDSAGRLWLDDLRLARAGT
jgi:hypothetical protein